MRYSLLLLLLVGCADTNWRLRETNDYFTLLNNDHDYTQGIDLQATNGHNSYAIGQDIYTPIHKREDPPRRDERPYAGYLYGSYSYNDRPLRYTIIPGWIGPGALGKEAQCGVHSLLGQYCPVGWHTQISNRPTLQGTVSKEWDYYRNTIIGAANLGTPKTSLSMEWRATILDYPEISTGPRLETIAHDAFLDSSGSTVTKRPYRATMFIRIRAWSVTYFLALQTPATKESHEAYNYGGIEITW